MRLSVVAIGRLRGGPESSLVEDYSTRIRSIGRPLGVTSFEIREMEAPKGLSGAKRQEQESALLRQSASPMAKRVVLDERGKNLSSSGFADQIARWRDEGAAEISFLIGGADGHHPSLAANADLVIAFGKATFPHMLVRTMLVEQIYRAMTILSGHPYHRG